MGQPDPIEEPPDDATPAPKDEARADWLCGPEEGLEAELLRRDAHATPAPKLFRPGADAAAEPPASHSRPRREEGAEEPQALRLVLPPSAEMPAPRLSRPGGPDEPGADAAGLPLPGIPLSKRTVPGAPAAQPDEPGTLSHGPTMLWEPGANSVPMLHREAPATPAAGARAAQAAAASPLDFPMDDAEERARATREAAEAAAAAAELAAQPHTVVAPEAFDLKDAPAPWWMQLPQMLREDRKVQVLAGLIVVLLMTLLFWPREGKSISIAGIRHDAARYDGQNVRVSGRVGEIFEVGGGHAYYLHQGRDTLVVFTRSRTPRRGQGVTVFGMLSTGYLNGQAGTALFEAPKH
ncbi:MAG: hypothetical protein IT347_02475 [Candidatus Eisenbacteria bacterium]|nr:hypothetical protein [Candidatus Eisenbacteria bacterium]